MMPGDIEAHEGGTVSEAGMEFNEQPAPVGNGHTPSWDLVIADMKSRDKVGRQRYGVPLQPMNGRNSLQDTYEEILDCAVYLRNLIEEEKIRAKLAQPIVASASTWRPINK